MLWSATVVARSLVQLLVLERPLQHRLSLVLALELLPLVQSQAERSLVCKQQRQVELQVAVLQREEEHHSSKASSWVVLVGQWLLVARWWVSSSHVCKAHKRAGLRHGLGAHIFTIWSISQPRLT